MISDLHMFASKDPSYLALQGHQNRITINVKVDSLAIDDLPGVGLKPSHAQRAAFVRHNLEAIREIVERKLEAGEAQPEDREGRPALGVRIRGIDFAEYVAVTGNRLSLAAFDLGAQAKWVGPAGRFA
jgi:hypothetical protein